MEATVRYTYHTPALRGPVRLYETPLLLDVEEAASCSFLCITGGSSSPDPTPTPTPTPPPEDVI